MEWPASAGDGAGRGLMLAISAIWPALLSGKEAAGVPVMILTVIQMDLFLAMISAAERALKREFDD